MRKLPSLCRTIGVTLVMIQSIVNRAIGNFTFQLSGTVQTNPPYHAKVAICVVPTTKGLLRLGRVVLYVLCLELVSLFTFLCFSNNVVHLKSQVNLVLKVQIL